MSAPAPERPAAATKLAADDVLIAKAQARALALLEASLADTSRAEAASSKRLARLLADDAGRDLLLDLTDQVLRIRDPKRAARRLHDLTAGGVPASLGPPTLPWPSSALSSNRLINAVLDRYFGHCTRAFSSKASSISIRWAMAAGPPKTGRH